MGNPGPEGSGGDVGGRIREELLLTDGAQKAMTRPQ